MLSQNEVYGLFETGPSALSAVFDAGLARGGDFCEVYFQYRVRTLLTIRDSVVCDAEHSVYRGAGVRVVAGTRFGYSHTSDLGKPALAAAAKSASFIAGSPAPGRSLPIADLRKYPAPYAELGPACFPENAKILLEGMDARMRSLDSRVTKTRATVCGGYDIILVANSEGLSVSDERPMTTLWANCTAEWKGARERNMTGFGGRRPVTDLTPEAVDRVCVRAVEDTVKLFDAVPAPAGECELVLGPGDSGILLHEAIGHGFEADFIRRGHSIFTGRMGERAASDEVTIVDSGTVFGGNGSIAMDDEGRPGQETVLVDRGIISSWMHDRISAAHFGVDPTGNGRREDYRHPPQARMRNTYMLPGRRSPEEVIASVKKGVYADQFSNGQVNIGPGEFTFYVKSGRLIENGVLGRPIKDVNIIGSGPRALADITMVADDLELSDVPGTCGKGGQTVAVSMGMPTVKIARITVGGVQ